MAPEFLHVYLQTFIIRNMNNCIILKLGEYNNTYSYDFQLT